MNIRESVKIFKALSNENRLQLFLEILNNEKVSINDDEHECIISEIASKFKIGAPTISHHIKELESAGLIHTDKIGKLITARINKGIIEEFRNLFKTS